MTPDRITRLGLLAAGALVTTIIGAAFVLLAADIAGEPPPEPRPSTAQHSGVRCRTLPPAAPLTTEEIESLVDDMLARCDDDAIDYLEVRYVERSGATRTERAGACEVAK